MPGVTLEQILYGNFIKYTRLRKLTEDCFAGSDANSVNIMIDVNSITNSAYRSNVEYDNPMIMVAICVNLCAHLRNYYRRSHNVETSFFLVFNNGKFDSSTKFYYNYNSGILNKMERFSGVTRDITNNMALLNTLVQYLPNIYLVSTNTESHIVINHLIKWLLSVGNNAPVIVITKNQLASLIPTVSENPNTVVFRPTKYKGDDTSYAITRSNAIIKHLTVSNSAYDRYAIETLDPSLLSLIMSLSSVSSHNIKPLFSVRKAVSMILEAIDSLKIPNSHINSPDLLNEIFPIATSDNIANRYKAIDLPFQTMLYESKPESIDTSFCVNLSDPDSVKQINEEYFIKYGTPLDLDSL